MSYSVPGVASDDPESSEFEGSTYINQRLSLIQPEEQHAFQWTRSRIAYFAVAIYCLMTTLTAMYYFSLTGSSIIPSDTTQFSSQSRIQHDPYENQPFNMQQVIEDYKVLHRYMMHPDTPDEKRRFLIKPGCKSNDIA